MDKISKLQKMIDECNNIAVITGAGISTDSGIKDFRSKDGLYNMSLFNDKPVEYMLSSRCFYNESNEFYKFYKKYMNSLQYEPNIAHYYLKKLEDKNKLAGIITQNIDGLHHKANSKKVYEVHGTIYSNHCIKCNKFYDANYVFSSIDVPICTCGGIIKPDVVLYGELLPSLPYEKSLDVIYKSDMLIIVGSSLTVYPVSNFINYFKGKYLVIINNEETKYDDLASLVIHKNIKEVFSKLK